MSSTKKFSERYIHFLLRYRIAILSFLVVVTGFFCYHLSSLKVATDFFSLYPPKHPYIQLYNQYRNMFGTANVLVIAIENQQGDIYNLETIAKIDRITRAIATIEGVNTQQISSITHPKLKNVQVTSWGIQITPVMYPQLPQNDTDLKRLKQGIYQNAGIRGFYVSADDKSAAIFAGFWEEGSNPVGLYKHLKKIQAEESDANTRIYFTGSPALYAYVYQLAPQVYLVFGLTILTMIVLLYGYFRSWRGVALPTLSATLSAIWGLGFASLLGVSLDPLIIVVPIIITARALSHSVQTIARYNEEYGRIRDRKGAIVKAYGELLMPGTLSIITDGTGVLLIAIATIPLMRNLAFFCSFWIVSIFISVQTLNPILLSFLRPPKESHIDIETGGRFYKSLARILVLPSMGKGRWVVIGIIAAILIIGVPYSLNLKVGDTDAGSALLFQDHPYNKASQFFNKNFVGANQLLIIAEGKEEGAVKSRESLAFIEDFQRYMEDEGGASGTLTFTNMVKRISRMFHEGNPVWEIIPENPKHLGQIAFQIASSSAPGEMDRWVDSSWTNATITAFYKNYNNDSIKQSLAKAKEFIKTRSGDSDKIEFRLAGGIIGILAAVNEEVEFSYWISLVVVFVAVFVLCAVTFKSVIAALVLIIPLAVSQILSEVFMLAKGIDLNFNSLPVAATAIGIGVDYGIYLTARISEEYRGCRDYDLAIQRALQTTGKAIIFTATTLIAGVIFWGFVDLKFQAEMGLLLGLLMFLNMINALVFIPSLVKIFKPKFEVVGSYICQ
jgi:uncharacterized protein